RAEKGQDQGTQPDVLHVHAVLAFPGPRPPPFGAAAGSLHRIHHLILRPEARAELTGMPAESVLRAVPGGRPPSLPCPVPRISPPLSPPPPPPLPPTSPAPPPPPPHP